ncbi:MAG TPA: dTDP-4-dehydrorhamnose reductase [Stenotrophomonas sp.]|nr:dTDP-4-dehydrorhamnose reductase [Stenotrophomonas sp.]
MKLLVFGANGQVGQELLGALAPLGEVFATTRTGRLPDGGACEVANFDRPQELSALLDQVQPDAVVNAAAYTAVDRAEQERAEAFRANAEGPGAVARWCAAHGVPMVHYSTDYVFDGRGTQPYQVDAATAPLGVYGQSKLAGEEAVRDAGGRHFIFRTAWVYAAHGHNFLRTMLRLGAERDELKVVGDQVGTPTPAALIADVTAEVLRTDDGKRSGTWHLTAEGHTTWHGFAEEIFQQALASGLVAKAPRITAITTAEYPTPARRPAYSCLSTDTLVRDFGVVLPSWQEGLKRVLAELAGAR